MPTPAIFMDYYANMRRLPYGLGRIDSASGTSFKIDARFSLFVADHLGQFLHPDTFTASWLDAKWKKNAKNHWVIETNHRVVLSEDLEFKLVKEEIVLEDHPLIYKDKESEIVLFAHDDYGLPTRYQPCEEDIMIPGYNFKFIYPQEECVTEFLNNEEGNTVSCREKSAERGIHEAYTAAHIP